MSVILSHNCVYIITCAMKKGYKYKMNQSTKLSVRLFAITIQYTCKNCKYTK